MQHLPSAIRAESTTVQVHVFFVSLCRVDINVDGIPAAASDVYNLQESTGGLDSQGFGLSSQSSTETAFHPVSNNTDSPDSNSTLAFNSQVNWGCQPFAGVGKRPLVSPGSSPVKQKPRVRCQTPADRCMEADLDYVAITVMLHSIETPSAHAQYVK